ncbi:MAG: AAA family ATPase [Clostridiales bacterium]|nr:AAA family ATPase [Clostridiales bacterium]
MALTFAVLSGKGGVGKSTFSVNIAFLLAKFNKKVLLIDGDTELRNLDILLGIQSNVLYDWSDVINGCEKEKAILDAGKNISLLPAPFKSREFSPEDIRKLLDRYSEDYDYIFIDGPAGVADSSLAYGQAAGQTLILVTPDPVSVRTAYMLGEKLTDLGLSADKMRLIINRLEFGKIRKGLQMSPDEIVDSTYLRLLGVIPKDEKLAVGYLKGKRIGANWPSYEAFSNIAERLMGRQVELSL